MRRRNATFLAALGDFCVCVIHYTFSLNDSLNDHLPDFLWSARARKVEAVRLFKVL